MKVSLKYNKKPLNILVKINSLLFLTFNLNKVRKSNELINISLITYNYILLIRILRQFGLAKPLLNRKDFY